jgi:hypothetical protein
MEASIIAQLPNENILDIFRNLPIAVLSAMYWEYCWHAPICQWSERLRIFLHNYFCNLVEITDADYTRDEIVGDGWETYINPNHILYRHFVNPNLIKKLTTTVVNDYHQTFINLETLNIKDTSISDRIVFSKLRILYATRVSFYGAETFFNTLTNLTTLHLENVRCPGLNFQPLLNIQLRVLTIINYHFFSRYDLNEQDLKELISRSSQSLEVLNYMETKQETTGVIQSIFDILYFVCTGNLELPNLRKLGGNIYNLEDKYANKITFPPKLECLEVCFTTGEIILYRWSEIYKFNGNIILRALDFSLNGFADFFYKKCVKEEPTEGKIHLMPFTDKTEHEKSLLIPYFSMHEITE